MKKYLCGMHHIGLPTNNMDATIEFYSKLGAEIVFEKTVYEAGKSIRVVHLKLSSLLIETYERSEISGVTGAIDHVAIEVNDIDGAYKYVKELGIPLLIDEISFSDYWPKPTRWFIIIGVNGERIEFTQSK
jgi:catechol 2,3-dioxygenase-like lactoylglutathione lyase family enzyme